MKKQKLILAIESSCDDTAASIISGDLAAKSPKFQIQSSVFKSQVPIHRKTGGVVPEVAARAHLQNILPVVDLALERGNYKLSDLDYLAVTSGPGLVVSLVVGVEFAKGLAYATGLPLLSTNHMAGHLYSAFIDHEGRGNTKKRINFPVLGVVVSGGHTMLLLMKNYSNYKVIGQTVDDAVGEAFDKVARVLGLPYPGGPEISRLALDSAASNPIHFPRPMLNQDNFDFSYSGLKTAVMNYVNTATKNGKKPLSRQHKANIAAAFQDAAVDVLVQKAERAAVKYKCKTLALAGGVAANQELRDRLQALARQKKMGFAKPPMAYCMDNAAMIGIAAYFGLRAGVKPKRTGDVKADPAWELG